MLIYPFSLARAGFPLLPKFPIFPFEPVILTPFSGIGIKNFNPQIVHFKAK